MATTIQELQAIAAKKYDMRVGPLNAVVREAEFWPTGNISLDYAMGGGVACGRQVEFFGRPSSGKTTAALQVAAMLQKIIIAGGDPKLGISANDFILYLDYEGTVDLDYAQALGLDVEHESFQITQPDTLEDGADFLILAAKTGLLRLAIVDSVASMVPSVQAEADSVGKAQFAVVARLMKTTGANLNPIMRKHNTSVIWINHEMEVISMGGPAGYGPPPVSTPGGVALKFFASQRVQFRQLASYKGKIVDPLTGEITEGPVAHDVRVKVVKNKMASPNRQAIVRVRYGRGFDAFVTAMQILVANEAVGFTKSTGRYYFDQVADKGGAPEWMKREPKAPNRPNIHGEKALVAHADEDDEWRQTMISLAEEVGRNNIDALKNARKLDAGEDTEESDAKTQELDDLLSSEEESGPKVKRVSF